MTFAIAAVRARNVRRPSDPDPHRHERLHFGLGFDGTPAIVLQSAEALGIELVTSSELESELVETLTSKFGWSAQRVREARERLWERAHWTSPEPLSGVVRDPDDNHVLAAAVASCSE